MRLICLLAAILLLTSQIAVAKEDEAEKKIRAAITDLQIDWVRPFKPIPGLYEIKSGKYIFYTDSQGHYLISGHIFDLKNKEDLTAARLEEINRLDWNRLPLDKAIISGPKGGMEVAIFTDPDCPFCRELELELIKTEGIRVYTFLYPLETLHPEARGKSEAIWCAKNRHKALHDVMLRDKKLSKARCKTPIGDIIALGQKLGIRGTPTLIARDGRVRSGRMTAARLRLWLAKAYRKQQTR